METAKHTVLKAVSYRIFTTIITVNIAWLITGNDEVAASIGAIDALVKIAFFSLHEHVWNLIQAGRNDRLPTSQTLSLVKAFSYRVLGSLITFNLVWFITGDTGFAFSVSLFDSVAKVGVYYLHERAWVRFWFVRAQNIPVPVKSRES